MYRSGSRVLRQHMAAGLGRTPVPSAAMLSSQARAGAVLAGIAAAGGVLVTGVVACEAAIETESTNDLRRFAAQLAHADQVSVTQVATAAYEVGMIVVSRNDEFDSSGPTMPVEARAPEALLIGLVRRAALLRQMASSDTPPTKQQLDDADHALQRVAWALRMCADRSDVTKQALLKANAVERISQACKLLPDDWTRLRSDLQSVTKVLS